MPTFRSAWHWVFGKHLPKPPDPDRTVEAGWIPQWMAPMVVEELNAQGIPAVTSDDYNLNPCDGPVVNRCLASSSPRTASPRREVMTDILGHPPATPAARGS